MFNKLGECRNHRLRRVQDMRFLFSTVTGTSPNAVRGGVLNSEAECSTGLLFGLVLVGGKFNPILETKVSTVRESSKESLRS